jgi:hypothetical protein
MIRLPTSNVSLVSFSQSSCVSPVQFTDGRGGEVVGEQPNHMSAAGKPGLLYSIQYSLIPAVHAAAAPGQLTCSPLVSTKDAELLHATSLLWRF